MMNYDRITKKANSEDWVCLCTNNPFCGNRKKSFNFVYTENAKKFF